MIRRHYFFILCFFLSLAIHAQPVADTLTAYRHYQQADSLKTAYQYDSARQYYQQAGEIYQQANAPEHYVHCLNQIAYCYYKDGQYDISLANARQAHTESTQKLGAYHAETANANEHIGDVYEVQSLYDTALLYYERALAIREKVFGKQHPKVAASLNDMGWIYCSKSKYERASAYYRKGLKILKETVGEWHDETSSIYNNIGNVFLGQIEYDSALFYYEKALSIDMKLLGEGDLVLVTYYQNIGTAYSGKNDYDKAVQYYNKAIKIQKKQLAKDHVAMAYSYECLGSVYHNRFLYDSAILLSKKALHIYERSLKGPDSHTAFLCEVISSAFRHKGMYMSALDYAQKSLNTRKSLFGENNLYTATSYTDIGEIYSNMGAFNQALQYCHTSLNIQKKVLRERHLLVASGYCSVGVIHFKKGDFKQSLVYHKMALDILEKGNSHLDLNISTYIYNNMGETCFALKQYKLSKQFHQKCLKIYKEMFPEYNSYVAFSYNSLGDIYHQLKDDQIALKNYQKAIDNIHKSTGAKSPYTAEFYIDIGKLYLDQNNYDSALFYYQAAIRANVTDFEDTAVEAQPQLDHYLHPLHLLTALQGKALAWEQYNQQQQLPYLQQAARTYQVCDSLLIMIQRTYANQSDRITLAEKAAQVYEGAIRVCLQLYEVTREDSYQSQAFYYAERSKMGAMAISLADYHAKKFAGIPDTLLEQERQLKAERSFYQTEIQIAKAATQGYDTARVDQYQQSLFALNRHYDSLMMVLEKQFPRYYQLKYQSEVLSLSAVQQKLDEHTAMLSYVAGDSAWYAFAITQQRCQVFTFSPDSLLQDQIQELSMSFTSETWGAYPQEMYEAYQQTAYPVYQQIVEPMLQSMPGVQKLVILPHGLLHDVPFDILPTQPITTDNSQRWPYLIRKFTISYGYAATLQWTNTPEPLQHLPRYLAFAPGNDQVTDTMPSLATNTTRHGVAPLLWNQQEVQQIGQYMSGTALSGTEASEADFKNQSAQYDVLHLAMHAVPDDRQPMLSKMIFSTAQDSTEDGLLHAYELYGMELPARLAVLSACHTGTGKLFQGEGMMSLSRAFAYAGCPSVVMSRWAAHDAATTLLMDRFYDHLSQGMAKDEALRQAKLDFLKQAPIQFQHPFYWGSWMVVGDTGALVEHKMTYYYIVYISLILLTIGVIVLKRNFIFKMT